MHFLQFASNCNSVLASLSHALYLSIYFNEIRQADCFIKADKSHNVGVYASNVTQNILFQFTILLVVLHLNFFQILVFFLIVVSIVTSITGIVFFYLFLSQDFFLVELLVWVVGIICFVVHCVVNISAFVVE